MDLGIPRRLQFSIALLATVVLGGTAGYAVLEGYGWFDALYATVTNMTTVGGGEVRPFHLPGKILTMLVVVIGFVAFTDAIVALVGYVVEGKLGAAVHSRRMRRRVALMQDHFILCGYGRVGSDIAAGFFAEGHPFVVVEQADVPIAAAVKAGFALVQGDASNESTLKEAGVMRARALVTALNGEADNVIVTLTARVLRPDLFIVARMTSIETEPKLRLAGANRVVSPDIIGGRRLANLAMRPTAVDFVDSILSSKDSELVLEEFRIGADSEWVGKSIAELLRTADDVSILAMKRGGRLRFRPRVSQVMLEVEDELVLAGPVEGIRALEGRIGRR